MTGAGLYVHIPFCKRKCPYCGFTSYPNLINPAIGGVNLAPQYIDSLQREITGYSKHHVSSIYVGGGTPTLLSGDQIIRISEEIGKNFNVDKNCEFSIEANPGAIDKEKLRLIKDAGVNRLSIGAQSFDDDELKILGRIHNSKQIYGAFEQAVNAGFKNINLDIIFSIPGQTIKSLKKTLSEAVKLKPAHISAYNLEIEEGTPFFEKKNELRLAGEETEFEMYKETMGFLKSAGYEHYEISNFSLSGYKCRHNIIYWENKEYIGLGASAASHIGGDRYVNTKDLMEYIENPIAGRTKEARSIRDEISETVFMGLRLIDGIDLGNFENRFGASLLKLYKKEVDEMIDLDLLAVNNGYLKLSQKGLFLANEVFERFV